MKPFKLDKIAKVSRHEIDLVNSLYDFLPATEARDKIHVAIRKALVKHLGHDIRYFLSAVQEMSYNDFIYQLPAVPVLGVIGLTPAKKKALIHIDSNIAHLVIGKLIGGDASIVRDARPLTETEQGVLQYIIMEVMAQIYIVCGSEPRFHFRFDKFAFDPSAISGYAGGKEGVSVMNIEVSVLNQSGFLRLVFPHAFLEEISGMRVSTDRSKSEKEHFKQQFADWSSIRTSVWAEAGTTTLSPAEIKGLESGDIILFDDSTITLDGRKVGGLAKIHFGTGESYVDADVIEAGAYKIKFKLRNL